MDKIVFNEGTAFECVGIAKQSGRDRQRVIIRLKGCPLAVAKEVFVAGAEYRHEWESAGENGTEVYGEDLGEYSIPGDLVDHRTGEITVYMSKPTELEKAHAVLAAATTLASVAQQVATGERPVDGLADVVVAFNEEAKKQGHAAPKPHEKPSKPGKPKP